MIKISKDNLFGRIGAFLTFKVIINGWFIGICIESKIDVLLVFCAVIVLAQIFIPKIWRYFLLCDVYLSDKSNEVIFRNPRGVERIFDRKHIIEQSTYFGITAVTIDSGRKTIKKYFMANSPQNLTNQDDRFQDSPDNFNFPEWVAQIPVLKLFMKYKILFFIWIIIMLIIMSIGFYFQTTKPRNIGLSI